MKTKYSTSFTVFPEHCNYMPPMVFGGKMLSEMDICAAMTVRRALYSVNLSRAVTVGVNNVKFFIGAEVGDLIHLHGEIMHIGIKSLTARVIGERENHDGKLDAICEGDFTMVTTEQPPSKVAIAHGLRDFVTGTLEKDNAWWDLPNSTFEGMTPRQVLYSRDCRPILRMACQRSN